MIHSNDEEKARQENEAAQSGEETCALRGGPKEGMGSWKEEEIIEAIVSVLTAQFKERMAYESRVIYECEARSIAQDVVALLKSS